MLKETPNGNSRTARKLNRWIETLNEYDMQIEHHPGNSGTMALPDFLSRHPITSTIIATVYEKQEDDPIIFRAPELLDIDEETEHSTNKNNLGDESQQTKENIQFQSILQNASSISRNEWITAVKSDFHLSNKLGIWAKYRDKLENKDGMVYFQLSDTYKLAIPKELVNQVLNHYHRNYTCHAGYSRMVRLITRLFMYPSIHKLIKDYLRKCHSCQQNKPLPLIKHARQITSSPPGPGIYSSIDLVGPINIRGTDEGHKHILTCIDEFSSWLEMTPLKNKTTAAVIEGLNIIFCRIGLPLSIHSDNGSEFTAGLFQRAARALGISITYSSPYHSQSLGKLERKHKEIGGMLKILTNQSGVNWHKNLPFIQYNINTAEDEDTGFSPWELFHGTSPRKCDFIKEDLPAESKITLDSIQLRNWYEDLQNIQEKTFGHSRAQKDLKKHLWAKRGPVVKERLEQGDLVYAKFPTTGGKLNRRLRGPYRIVQISPGGATRIILLDEKHGRTARIHVTKLRKIDDELLQEEYKDLKPMLNKPINISKNKITQKELLLRNRDLLPPRYITKTKFEPKKRNNKFINPAINKHGMALRRRRNNNH